MSKAHSGTESCIGSSTSPSIESGRFERAVTEAMTVERVADRFYEVHSQSGSTYEIDLQAGACTCPDCQQRGDQYVCKHAIRASLAEVIASGVTTRTVAKVAGYTRDPDHDCPTEGHGGDYAGPLAGRDTALENQAGFAELRRSLRAVDRSVVSPCGARLARRRLNCEVSFFADVMNALGEGNRDPLALKGCLGRDD